MDEKKFARLITKLFDKKTPIKKIENIITDGYILYRGELELDVFYRLRLEATGQLELDLEKSDSLFAGVENAPETELHLLYNLPWGDKRDVYAVGSSDNGRRPYISFNQKYRPLFEQGWELRMNQNFIDSEGNWMNAITNAVYLKTEFGDIIVMPMRLDDEFIYR